MSRSDSVVTVEGLRKTFRIGFGGRRKVDALQGIEFEVRRGHLFGFLGPNGAGKSTTIKMLAGLLFPTSGRISVLGGSPTDVAVRSRYGYLPENPAFHDHLTGREILTFMGALLGLEATRVRARTEAMLALTNLQGAADIQVRRYSKGMTQRLGIAQALLHDPELVILDEPMSGFDPVGRREVKDIILDLRSQGKTVFFSTHIIPDVEEICDEVTILVRGRVARSGAVKDLIGSGPRQFEIRATGVPPQFSHDGTRRSAGDQDIFLVNDEDTARGLVEGLWGAGAKVQALNVHRYSLENLFLTEVGKGAVGGVVSFD